MTNRMDGAGHPFCDTAVYILYGPRETMIQPPIKFNAERYRRTFVSPNNNISIKS